MSDTPQTSALQFDRAEFGAGPTALECRGCHRPISDSYFEINGMTTCPECRTEVEQSVAVGPGPMGVVRATGAGIAAGCVGAVIYYAVAAVSGYEFGLIAIAVGYLVGRAVRWGSGNRGGRGYQVLAVAITYVAIVSTYVPFLMQAIRQPAHEKATVAASASTTSRPAAQRGTEERRMPTVVAWALIAGLILALPFLAGFANILGWIIIGIALFEAWKINRRVHIDITGPFTVPPAIPQSAS